jgi:hypothetical protein
MHSQNLPLLSTWRQRHADDLKGVVQAPSCDQPNEVALVAVDEPG